MNPKDEEEGHHIKKSTSEKAFDHYSSAAYALQKLDLNASIPKDFSNEDTPLLKTSDIHVYENEQSNIYCGWAESSLYKYRQ